LNLTGAFHGCRRKGAAFAEVALEHYLLLRERRRWGFGKVANCAQVMLIEVTNLKQRWQAYTYKKLTISGKTQARSVT
jgi:hypothetical protein